MLSLITGWYFSPRFVVFFEFMVVDSTLHSLLLLGVLFVVHPCSIVCTDWIATCTREYLLINFPVALAKKISTPPHVYICLQVASREIPNFYQ